MCPDAKLRIAEPLWCLVRLQRLPRRLKSPRQHLFVILADRHLILLCRRCRRKLPDHRTVFHPGNHVQHQVVPVLETLVHDGRTRFGVVVFVQRTFPFQVVAKQGDGLLGHLACFLVESVVRQSAEHHIVRDAPDRSLPVRGIVRRPQVVHLLQFRQRAHAVGCPECTLVQQVLAHHALSLLLCGYTCPQRHEARPRTQSLNQTGIVAWCPFVQHERLAEDDLGFTGIRQQVQVHRVVHAVLLVPAVRPDGLAQCLGIGLILPCRLRHLQPTGQISHGLQFAYHQTVQVYLVVVTRQFVVEQGAYLGGHLALSGQ